MTDPTHEREDSLSQEWKIEMGWNGADRVPFLIRDGIDGVRLDVESAAFIDSLMKRPDANSIVKAAFEAAAQYIKQIASVLEGQEVKFALFELANGMLHDLPPESAILGAQIAELEARLEEAKRVWEPIPQDSGYTSLLFWIKRQDDLAGERIADLESQIAALKAKREGGAKK